MPPPCTLDVGHLDDDVMLGFDRADVVYFQLDAMDEFEMGCSILPPHFYLRQ